MKGCSIIYSEEEIRFLKRVSDFPRPRITKWFNILFQRNLTVGNIRAKMCRMGYRCPNQGKFIKGQTPWNKGTKGVMPRPVNAFKKGCEPHNCRPIGSSRVNKDGCIEIKIAEPDVWEYRSRVVYCQYYKLDAIPDGYVVWHKNGNSEDDSPENLELISRGELMMLCKFRHKQSADELKPTVALLAKLKYKKYQKRKKK